MLVTCDTHQELISHPYSFPTSHAVLLAQTLSTYLFTAAWSSSPSANHLTRYRRTGVFRFMSPPDMICSGCREFSPKARRLDDEGEADEAVGGVGTTGLGMLTGDRIRYESEYRTGADGLACCCSVEIGIFPRPI